MKSTLGICLILAPIIFLFAILAADGGIQAAMVCFSISLLCIASICAGVIVLIPEMTKPSA